ncbi:hypothetical protein ETAA1_43560 [Urbifossiella limnaea]|uniref:Uncharacterized protein n=1 Tax=Urbifossiella limnaea TaxID=2528023 RepID=A0A517XY01_9BACT|nr:hypothetical protein ETAA1_43560 [Urbifossiella limnaea]
MSLTTCTGVLQSGLNHGRNVLWRLSPARGHTMIRWRALASTAAFARLFPSTGTHGNRPS